MKPARQPAPVRSVLITGASSGIGAALAAAYAAPGIALALGGRDEDRLAAVAAACRRAGARAVGSVVDVTDRAAMASWIETAERTAPLDLVIANAGIAGAVAGTDQLERARQIFAVNFEGVLNTIEPALAPMLARGSGQLALMSSLASFRGFPSAPAYSASKAAVRLYAEGLRARLRHHGILVAVVCPGFVRTPMTSGNPFPMPLTMSPARAAALIRRRLTRGKARIAFPWPSYAAVRLLEALPPALSDRWLARVPEKE
jgi:short-subunit dehydrogenase